MNLQLKNLGTGEVQTFAVDESNTVHLPSGRFSSPDGLLPNNIRIKGKLIEDRSDLKNV